MHARIWRALWMPGFGVLCKQLLEGSFLVSAVLVLVAGMVFSADGFTPGSTGYNLLTVAVAGTILSATAAFALLLSFETYRSVKYAEAHLLARRVEEEAVEEALLGRWRRRSTGAPGLSTGGGIRRRSSIISTMQRGSSLAQQLSVALGRPFTGASTASEGQLVEVSPGHAGDGGYDNATPSSQRRTSSYVACATARQRRGSPLGRLQEVVGGGGDWGSTGGRGRRDGAAGGDMPADESSGSAGGLRGKAPAHDQAAARPHKSPPPPPPLAPRPSGANATAPAPPPPPPRADVRDADVAAAAARSTRVLTMASKQRTAIRVVHRVPGAPMGHGDQ
jgi:hypothetical protein